MPPNLLAVPHFRQEFDYSCVAACARMALAFAGTPKSEAELRTLLDTQATGTRAGSLMRLSGPDFEVQLRPTNRTELVSMLASGIPPIVFLKTGVLEHWKLDIFHTVVIVGIDAQSVSIHDPYFDAGPQTVSLANFEKAWAHTGQFACFIRRRQKR